MWHTLQSLPSRETIARFVVSVAPASAPHPPETFAEYMRRWRRRNGITKGRAWVRRPQLAGLKVGSREYKREWTRLKRRRAAAAKLRAAA